MAQRRIILDNLLRATLGSGNVYFDPPESFKLKYPCIVYSFGGNNDIPADDSIYHRRKRYAMLYITRDADDPMVDTLDDLKYCRMSRAYTADGLFHYAYDIYF